MKTKTIGPMTRVNKRYWDLSPNAWLCDSSLQERFNIPSTATKLWVTLTQHSPEHGDAIRVRRSGGSDPRLDNERYCTYISQCLYKEAQDFGSDFWATIYYE